MDWLIDPLRYLPRFQLPKTIEEAEEYVSWRLETATLLWVCARYLPGAFPLELAGDQELLLPSRRVPWSVGEYKCHELLGERLLPFSIDSPEMMAMEEDARMSYIPILPEGLDHWTNGFDEYNKGWLMLGLLDRQASSTDLGGLPQEARAALTHAHPYHGISWCEEDIVEVCNRAGTPYNALPTAIHILDHSTENVYLDPTYDMPLEDNFAWGDREAFEYLIFEWEEAQEMMGRAEHLTEYLVAHPSHLRKVVDLWNLALWNMAMR